MSIGPWGMPPEVVRRSDEDLRRGQSRSLRRALVALGAVVVALAAGVAWWVTR